MQSHHPLPETVPNVTVGLEAEVHSLPFILIEVDPRTQKKKMTVLEGDAVLSVYSPTQARTECVSDDITLNPLCRAYLTEVCNDQNYRMLTAKTVHVLEFVTLPSKSGNELDDQFNEIERIERDLIDYLLKQKQDNPRQKLVCIKNWIDHYNTRYPESPLPSSSETEKMHIVLDYSILQLQRLLTTENKTDSEELLSLPAQASLMQAQLIHHPQYNFVVALGKRMGSMLIEIFDANNDTEEYQGRILLLQNKMTETRDRLSSHECDQDKAAAELQALSESIEQNKAYIRLTQVKKDILRRAEINAEKVCDYIRKEQTQKYQHFTRKLIKLEGFFFILSMRIITETENLVTATNTSEKHHYLFFLKTKLSDLRLSLSDNDRALLQEINQTWTVNQKSMLFTYLSGSSEILSSRFVQEFSAKEVIESALGWNTQQPQLCDRLPNSPTKPFDPPFEPKGLRRKDQTIPTRRILLEYRYAKSGRLQEAKSCMKNMLQTATELCKTTRAHKEDWSLANEEKVSILLHKKDSTPHEKAKILRQIQLYKPNLFQAVQSKIPKPVTQHLLDHHEAKLLLDEEQQKVDHCLSKAIRFISNLKQLPNQTEHEYMVIFNELKKILTHDNSDQTLKQINYIFLKSQEPGFVTEQQRAWLRPFLMELYAEKILSMFKPPLKPSNDGRVHYLMDRYALTSQIPAISEFFNFLFLFREKFFSETTISLLNHERELRIHYSFTSAAIAEINKSRRLVELLKRGINLPHFAEALFSSGIKVSHHDMIKAFNESILTPALAERFLNAGVDIDECLSLLTHPAQIAHFEKIKKQLVKVTLHTPPPTHTVLFKEEVKPKNISFEAFKNELLACLSAATGCNPTEKYQIQVLLLAHKPHLNNEPELYQLLVTIHGKLRDIKLRVLLDPILNKLFQQLSVPDSHNLGQYFTKQTPSSNM